MSRSWNEVQGLGVRAAVGAGVPAAQALAFGAMLARHIADGGAEAPVSAILKTPDRIVALAQRVEEIIEAASVSQRPVPGEEPDAGLRTLLVSWLLSLPCLSAVDVSGPRVLAALDLKAPSNRGRPERLEVSDALQTQLSDLAALTYVPDSESSRALGAGAGLMDTD